MKDTTALALIVCTSLICTTVMVVFDSLSNDEKVIRCLVGYSLDPQTLAKMSGDDLRDYLERTPSHGVSELSCAEAMEIERRVLR